MSKEQWFVSDNEANWQYCCDEFDSKEEAIAGVFGVMDWLEDGDTFYVGKQGTLKVNLSVDHILEYIGEDAYEQVGELADDWPCLTKDQRENLESELNNVLKNHLVMAGEWERIYPIDCISEHTYSSSKTQPARGMNEVGM